MTKVKRRAMRYGASSLITEQPFARLTAGGKHGAAIAGCALLCVYYSLMTLYGQVICYLFYIDGHTFLLTRAYKDWVVPARKF